MSDLGIAVVCVACCLIVVTVIFIEVLSIKFSNIDNSIRAIMKKLDEMSQKDIDN